MGVGKWLKLNWVNQSSSNGGTEKIMNHKSEGMIKAMIFQIKPNRVLCGQRWENHEACSCYETLGTCADCDRSTQYMSLTTTWSLARSIHCPHLILQSVCHKDHTPSPWTQPLPCQDLKIHLGHSYQKLRDFDQSGTPREFLRETLFWLTWCGDVLEVKCLVLRWINYDFPWLHDKDQIAPKTASRLILYHFIHQSCQRNETVERDALSSSVWLDTSPPEWLPRMLASEIILNFGSE